MEAKEEQRKEGGGGKREEAGQRRAAIEQRQSREGETNESTAKAQGRTRKPRGRIHGNSG
jgi:hypothetical protein